MIINQYNHPFQVRKLRIAALGDFHLGHKGCNKQKLLTDLKWIKRQKNMLVILMGDILEVSPPLLEPKRYVKDETDPQLDTFDKAYDYAIWLLRDLTPKIIGLHRGNHDFKYMNKTGHNYVKKLCKDLNITYLEDTALTRLLIGDRPFDIYSTHGYGGGRKRGAKINRLEAQAAYYYADIYLMGHVHDIVGSRSIRLKLTNKGLVREKIAFAITGTYLNSHVENSSSYGERGMYPPNKIGLITIEISPRRRDIHVKE